MLQIALVQLTVKKNHLQQKFNIGDIFMEHVFRVLRKDHKGKPIRDDDDELIYDEYVYNFELMSMDRMLVARKLFLKSQEDYTWQPKNFDELSELVTRETERKAFAAILMKRIDGNEFEYFDEYKTSAFDALREIKGSDNFNKLMMCQENFFLKAKLLSPESARQSINIMKQSIDILNNYKALEESSGLGMKELLTMFVQSTKLPQEKKPEESISEATS